MQWPPYQPPAHNLLCLLVAMFAALAVGSVVRLAALRRAEPAKRSQRLASLATWWVLALLLAAAVLLGRYGICLLLGAASMFAIREYVRLAAPRRADRPAAALLYAAIAVHYLLVLFDLRAGLYVFLPVAMLLVLTALQVSQGETKGYVRSTAGLFWGAMVLVYGLAHAALLLTIPPSANPAGGSAGWFFYLVLLTETDDIAQALVGRQFGAHQRHRIVPRISPNKTWEGFLGGMAVTVALAVILSPLLTPLAEAPLRWGDNEWRIPYFWPVVSGILIAVSGFFGDINMSAVKRDAGVKDGSTLLPGMGGMIDRVDSLTFAAPAFYYLVYWLVQ